jgi:hypothetical protein
VHDREAITAAAARFWLAWSVATVFHDDGVPPVDLVVEVHEAARELIRATKTTDLRAAYEVLTELVHEVTRSNPCVN